MPLAIALAIALAPRTAVSQAQPSAPPQPASADQPATAEPTPPIGKVLFSRDASAAPEAKPATLPSEPPPSPAPAPKQDDPLAVTDAERTSLTFTAYDLDVHLVPATAAISVRAGFTVRNDGTAPLHRLILQISSTLHWDAISLRATRTTPLTFAARLAETDADHTGRMSEAVVPLPQPLAPGASLDLTALYSGAIPPSGERLERIGAPADQALSADWDAVADSDPSGLTGGTALRGFGNVLWYPVSALPVFLGDGARLFQAVGSTKLHQSAATVSLRLAVEYVGDPPNAAFFCGRREQLIAISDNPNLPAAESPGVATAVFAPHPLDFRTPSLFISSNAATATGTPANSDLISAVTGHYDALPAYAAAAAQVEPLLTDWFGPQPLSSLTVLDHPGQPFEDDALLVRPVRAVEPAALAPSLAHSLTHVWIRSSRPWIDEGLAQFITLLWTERTAGRAAALAQLQDDARTLALAEPEVPIAAHDLSEDRPLVSPIAPIPSDASQSSSSSSNPQQPAPSVSPAGTSLAEATGDVFYRTKAAAVWWMLRGIVGDDDLKRTLQAYRADPKLDHDPTGFEHTLEKLSHKDLRWFFDNWVYRDLGLPDLSIVSVTPSQLESHADLPAGWLVAVVVHNDGYAEAEVPVTVRSGTAHETQRLRIAGRSNASTRIVFAGSPEQVDVNDGSIPETQTSIHTRQLVLPSH